ncbi:MAG: hypothetical protein ACSW8J_02505, partial [bacterium]
MMWKRIISFAVMMGLLCPLAWAEPENNTQFSLYDFTYFVANRNKKAEFELEHGLFADLEKGIDLYCEDLTEDFDLILKLNNEEQREPIEINKNERKLDYETIKDYISDNDTGRYIEITVAIIIKPDESGNLKYLDDLFEKWNLYDYGSAFHEKDVIPIWRGRIYDDNDKGKLELHLCAACQIDEEGMHDMKNSDNNTYFISDQLIDWSLGSPAHIKLAKGFELVGVNKDETNEYWIIDNKDVEKVSLKYIPEKFTSTAKPTPAPTDITPAPSATTESTDAATSEPTATPTPELSATSTTESTDTTPDPDTSATSEPTTTPTPEPIIPQIQGIEAVSEGILTEGNVESGYSVDVFPDDRNALIELNVRANIRFGEGAMVCFNGGEDAGNEPVISSSVPISSVEANKVELYIKVSSDLSGDANREPMDSSSISTSSVEINGDQDGGSTVCVSIMVPEHEIRFTLRIVDESGKESAPVALTLRRVKPIELDGE